MKQKSEIGKKSPEKEENNLINIQNSKDKEKNKTFFTWNETAFGNWSCFGWRTRFISS